MTEEKLLKEKIRNSTVFYIDKEKDSVSFQTERLKFIENLYVYWKRNDKEEYLVEVVETADRIIKYYKEEKGDIIHLFNAIMKKQVIAAKAKEGNYKSYAGIKIPNKEKKEIRQMKACMKIIKEKYSDISTRELTEKISQMMGITQSEVRQLQITNNLLILNIKDPVGGEDESSKWEDIIPAVEFDTDKKNEMDDLLRLLEIQFQKERKNIRRREMLSKLLTVIILRDLIQSYYDWEEFFEGLSFANAEIIEEFKATKRIPLQREIAQSFGVNEAHTSRLIREFAKKVQKLSAASI